MATNYDAAPEHLYDPPNNIGEALPSLTDEESAAIDELMENAAAGKNYIQAFTKVTGRTPAEYAGRSAEPEPAEEPNGQFTLLPRPVRRAPGRYRSPRALESQDRRPDLKPKVPKLGELQPPSADTQPVPPPKSQSEIDSDRSFNAYMTGYMDGAFGLDDLPLWVRRRMQER